MLLRDKGKLSQRSDSKQHNLDGRGKTKRKSAAVQRAQSLLWYEALLESGVCILGDGKYSVTLKLSDINYQMATEEHQQGLLENYARFFNKFSQNEQLMITIINRRIERDALAAKVLFPEPRYGDALTEYRTDHNRIVRSKLGDRRYRIVAEKFVTLTVTSPSLEQAKESLHRLSRTVTTQMWSLLECRAEQLDGVARIEILRELTRRCYRKGFDYAGMATSGATTRDELAPMEVDLAKQNRMVLTGDAGEIYCQCLLLRDYPTWLADTLRLIHRV